MPKQTIINNETDWGPEADKMNSNFTELYTTTNKISSEMGSNGIISYNSTTEQTIVKCIKRIQVWVDSTLSSKDISLAMAGFVSAKPAFRVWNKTDGVSLGILYGTETVQPTTGIVEYKGKTTGSAYVSVLFDWSLYTTALDSTTSTVLLIKNYIDDSSFIANFNLVAINRYLEYKGIISYNTATEQTIVKCIKRIQVWVDSTLSSKDISLVWAGFLYGKPTFRVWNKTDGVSLGILYGTETVQPTTGIVEYKGKTTGSAYVNVLFDWSLYTTGLESTTSTILLVKNFINDNSFIINFSDLKSLSDISSIVSLSLATYGQSTLVGTLYSVGLTEDILATLENQQAANDGVLNSITIAVHLATNIRFAIGTIDQRGYALIRKEFTVQNSSSGLITLNVINQNIAIGKGEYLFHKFTPVSVNEGQWLYGIHTSTSSVQLLYGTEKGIIKRLGSGLGAYIALKWDVKQVTGMLAVQADLIKTNDTLIDVSKIANKALEKSGIVYDRAGKAYKQVVVNNIIQLISLQYENVLIFGNSWTIHEGSSTIGWYATDRGMSASVDTTDFVAHLEKAFKLVLANAAVTKINGKPYERDFTLSLDTLFSSYLSVNFNAIVVQIGINIPTSETLSSVQTAYETLINYLYTKWPSAEVYVMSLPDTGLKTTAIYNACNSTHANYINIVGTVNKSKLGFYNKGNGVYAANLYPVINYAVADHPSDLGMLNTANMILAAMQYEQLTLSHSISVSGSGSYYCPSSWVEGGIVTVLIYDLVSPTISVKDINNTAITATLHDMSAVDWQTVPSPLPVFAYTFVMPSTNVNIQFNI